MKSKRLWTLIAGGTVTPLLIALGLPDWLVQAVLALAGVYIGAETLRPSGAPAVGKAPG